MAATELLGGATSLMYCRRADVLLRRLDFIWIYAGAEAAEDSTKTGHFFNLFQNDLYLGIVCITLRLQRPLATINDCGAALAVNPESAKA